jgi:DnaK suppressor protein
MGSTRLNSRASQGEIVDYSSVDKQSFVQHLLRGRERVLLTSAAAQRSLPFGNSGLPRHGSREHASDEAIRSMAGNARAIEAKRQVWELAAITRALVRLEGGTYGRCESCGVDIPTERLKAQLTATHCIECERAAAHTPP